MPKLELRLFGGFEAKVGNRIIYFPTRHAALLLVRLALEPDRKLARGRLAALLWPDRSEDQARVSLRQAIYRLRTALAAADPDPLEVNGTHVALSRSAVRSDLQELESADPRDIEALARVLAMAQGVLLAGFEADEAEFDEWLLTERVRVQGLVMERLRQLAACREAERRFADVEALARRQLALEPFDEAALRTLMAALAHQGRRNAALAAFRVQAERLRAELSVAPEPSTVALWQAIRNGSVKSEVSPPPTQPESRIPSVASAASDTTEVEAKKQHVAILHISTLTLAGPIEWDPEAAAEATAALGDRLKGMVTSQGGRVLRSDVGEFVALFGGELSALTAARTALFVQEAEGLSAGVHTGDVLVDGRHDPGPLGLVARRLAEAGTEGVRLSNEARIACEGFLLLDPGPPLALPGLGDSMRTWHVVGETGARNRWQARGGRRLSPLVGREAELALLHQMLARSQSSSVAVLLSGEAGMGKSRLLHELLTSREAQDRTIIEVSAAEWQTDVPQSALNALLRAIAQHDPGEAPGATWRTLAGRLQALRAPASIYAPLRALLDLPVEDDWSALPTGERQRRTAEALAALLSLEADEQPILLAVEDAHWIDPESARVFDEVGMRLGRTPILLIVTARPEVRPRWLGQSFARHLHLEGLDAEHTRQLLRHVARERGSRSADFVKLHARTGGVPLFIEEVVHHMNEVEEDVGEDPSLPVSLQALLASRVERLTPNQLRLLQAASVIGSTVPESLLRPMVDFAPDTFGEALDGLAAAELLHLVRVRPERTYAFKHALTQEAAYRGLLRARRQNVHRRLLALLEARAAEGTETAVEDLARHARLGAVWEKAAAYGTQAGERALARSAPTTAQTHFERALDGLGRLPANDRTRGLAVDLRVRLRPALMLTGDYSRVLETLAAAEADAAELGDERRLTEIRTHIAFFRATDGGFDEGLEVSLKAEAGARRLKDAVLLAEAQLAKGELLRRRGDYQGAISTLEASLATWTGANRLHRGTNMGTRSVFARGHLAVCRAYLGHRAAARVVVNEARALADETSRLVDRQFALLHDGIVTELEGRVVESIPLFEAALGLARTAELPFFVDWIIVELGEALMALGDGRRALALLEAACTRPSASVVPQFRALAQVALGKALIMAERRDAAEVVLADVLAYARRVGHRQLEQMALRRTTLAIAPHDPLRALTLLDDAITVAEANGLALGLAKNLEIRVALLRDMGRHSEAAQAESRAAAMRRALALPAWEGRPEPVG